jgi:preprotein translocase subunit Sec61beta
MLQWRPRLVVLVAILVVIAVVAAGYIENLVDGLTW